MCSGSNFEKTNLIKTQELCKSYGETKALDRLFLTLNRGEILGLLGPNGAGKTTAIQIMLGLLRPTSGKALVMGFDPLKERHLIAKHLNFSSSYGSLPPNLKVMESLRTFARLYNVKDSKAMIQKLLETFEIQHLADRIYGALSSGEKTRLNLAKSFLNDPILLVLDEPTSSLDPDMSDKVRKILKSIQRQRNMGILYTSHNMFEVESLCDRILFIHEGKTIAEGTPDEIRRLFSSSSLEQAFIKIVREGDLISRKEA